jgi:hypothetical protein
LQHFGSFRIVRVIGDKAVVIFVLEEDDGVTEVISDAVLEMGFPVAESEAAFGKTVRCWLVFEDFQAVEVVTDFAVLVLVQQNDLPDEALVQRI